MKSDGKECLICAVTYRGKAINKLISLMFVPVAITCTLSPVHPVAWSDLVTCADGIQFRGANSGATIRSREPLPKSPPTMSESV